MKTNFLKRFSALTYLLGAFTLVSIIPIIFISIVQYDFIKNHILSRIEESNIKSVEDLAEKIELMIEGDRRSLMVLAYAISDDTEDQMKAKFKNILKNNSDFNFISYISNGSIYYLYDKEFYKNNETYPKFTDLELSNIQKAKNKSYVIPSLKGFPDSLAISINWGDDKYLIAGLNKEKIKEYLMKISNEDEKIFLLDLNSKSYVFNSHDIPEEHVREMVLKKSGIMEKSELGKTIIFSKLKTLNMLVIMSHKHSLYEEELRNHGADILIILVNSLLFSLFMGAWIAFSQFRFVTKFLDSIREIANGNYKKKVDIGLILIPKEFISLVEEFNIMSEKIYRLDAFKSNLIDTISHEFKTPLTSIKGFTSTMLRRDANFAEEERKKMLKIISKQSDRLSRMVEDLLVVPKLEGNILKLNIQPVNLEHVISSNSDLFNVNLFEIESIGSIYVEADEDRLHQVVLNLFENARKYSDPQETKIKVKIFKKDDNTACFTVTNKSKPIPKEKINSLFEKFVRMDDGLTRTTGGTGLGLFITKGLVEIMGGKIILESIDNEFISTVFLPLSDEALL